MSTCFLPVAADLMAGDEVTKIGTTALSPARTVASRVLDGERVLLVFGDGSEFVAEPHDDVLITPPF